MLCVMAVIGATTKRRLSTSMPAASSRMVAMPTILAMRDIWMAEATASLLRPLPDWIVSETASMAPSRAPKLVSNPASAALAPSTSPAPVWATMACAEPI
ncbi:hypothetical protein D3C85_1749290 [compost metagenome]